jgi:hypothetical protein
MKKFLLPAKREASDVSKVSGSSTTISGSVASSSNNECTNKGIAAAAVAAPVVIKIESDNSDDSAFECGPPRVLEQKPKRGIKQKNVRIKNDGPSVEPPSASFPAFPADIEDAQGSLLAWCDCRDVPPPGLICACRYVANKRDLPWRRQAGPNVAYGVWVSEVMLQQTRVATVVEYWNRWMAKWPSLHQLAASNIDDVNAMWSGLGYYRRARMLLEVSSSSSRACA